MAIVITVSFGMKTSLSSEPRTSVMGKASGMMVSLSVLEGGNTWFSLCERVQIVRNTDVRSMNGAGGYLGNYTVNIPEPEVYEE